MFLGLGLAVMLSAALLCAARVAGMALQWRRGRSIGGLTAGDILVVPHRYLYDLHDVVARRPRNAVMHGTLAGGFLAAFVLMLPCLVWPGGPLPLAACLLAVAVSAYGLGIEARRRARGAGEALSSGQYVRLPLAIGGGLFFAAGMAMASYVGGNVGFVLAAVAALTGFVSLGRLAWTAGSGPMRHAFAGLANLAMHPRGDRFSGGRSTGLRALDLDGPILGAARIEDFTVSQLASFDACVQCGRCEEVCPAFAAGMPLNPKQFVNELAASLRGPDQVHYAGNPHPGTPDLGRVIALSDDGRWGVAADTVWACTTCRACVEACPMMIEHVDAMIDLRRSEVLRHGAITPVAQAVLENLAQTDTQGGFDLGARFDWAVDLKLSRIEQTRRAEVLLWVGESAFDRRAQRSLRALVSLLRRAGVEPQVLGHEELDCGDQARRLGDEATFQGLARRNIETLNRYEFDVLLTADPHALHVLRNEYPELGGRYRVRHHTDLLSELLDQRRLVPVSTSAERVTYHDPCYLGRYNGEYDAPRRILAAIGSDLVEMERSGPRSHCCGGGGGAPLTDVASERRIPDMRMTQVEATGATCVAVACPGCTAMLEGVSAKAAEVKDIAELLDVATRAAA